MSNIRTLLAVVALVFGAGRLSAQGYVVVVNTANPVTSLSKDKAANIFLKRLVRWDNGIPIMPVNLDRGSRTRVAFSEEVHGKRVDAIEAHWQSQIFAGRDAPPPVRASDAEVLAFVRANPGAIGYVSREAALGTEVKAIPIQ